MTVLAGHAHLGTECANTLDSGHRAIVVCERALNSTSHHLNLIVKLTLGSGEGVGRSQKTWIAVDPSRAKHSEEPLPSLKGTSGLWSIIDQ